MWYVFQKTVQLNVLSINQPGKDKVEHHFHVQMNTILRELAIVESAKVNYKHTHSDPK